MKQLLEMDEYNFLKTNLDLEKLIFLVVSGSRAYGTNNEHSDLDLRGIAIEGKNHIYGLDTFEQFEDRTTDTVIYGLKKFVGLLVKANPNAMELLGVEKNCIVFANDMGWLLRDNAELFLSKRVISSFGNYALAQLRRLQNALCHDSYTEAEQTKHLRNVLNSQLDHFRNHYSSFPSGAINIAMENEAQTELILDIKLGGYPLKDFVGIASELNSIVKTYTKLNHRNNKKDEKALYKHAMHLIRLLMTGTDILEGNGIITKRSEEQKLLLDIRDGRYSFDDIFKMTNDYQGKFELASETTKLPNEPDMNKINGLLTKIFETNLVIGGGTRSI